MKDMDRRCSASTKDGYWDEVTSKTFSELHLNAVPENVQNYDKSPKEVGHWAPGARTQRPESGMAVCSASFFGDLNLCPLLHGHGHQENIHLLIYLSTF